MTVGVHVVKNAAEAMGLKDNVTRKTLLAQWRDENLSEAEAKTHRKGEAQSGVVNKAVAGNSKKKRSNAKRKNRTFFGYF